MKKIFLAVLVLFAFGGSGQVFSGSTGAIQNTGNETYFTAQVSGLPAAIDSTFGLEQVTIDISHATVEELYVYLKSPSGTIVELTEGASCSGPNYTGTTFRADSPNSITLGTAPFTGTFRPTGYLGRFNTGQPGNGAWTLIVKDWLFGGNSGSVVSWSIKFSNAAPHPVILKSSNLPIVIINTNNKPFSDVSDLVVDFGIIYNGQGRNNVTDPVNNYNGKANMHIRGSSSKIFEKKSYKIELCDASGVMPINAQLVDMPAESDWVLTAGYSDKTLLRNALTHHLFDEMGHYSIRTRFVEVIINGEYSGVYSLMEQPKRGPNRVDISKLAPIDNNFPDITGGYIIQINRTDNPGWYSLYPGISGPGAKFYYQYNYPNAQNISPQQKDYIKAVMDTFEMVMNSPNFNDPKTGYMRMIDVVSFADFLILNEFSKDVDAYKLSTYLYKDKSTKGNLLHAGPMWDYDLAWHNCDYGNAFDYHYWQFEQPNNDTPIPTWWKTLMSDKIFADIVNCRWQNFRRNVLSESAVKSYVGQVASMLGEAQQRNFRQFPILGSHIFPNPQNEAGASYATEISDLQQWIHDRGLWIDQNLPGVCPNVGLPEVSGRTIATYPNPFTDELVISTEYLSGNALTVIVTDVTGKNVYTQTHPVNGSEIRLQLRDLAPGAYILMLNSTDGAVQRKVIKSN